MIQIGASTVLGMTDTPLLLLDVDGVLNAVCGETFPETWTDWEVGEARAQTTWWRICYSPSVVSALQELHAAGAVEIRWLTTWAQDANGSLLDLLGFQQPFEVVAGPRDFPHSWSTWWKYLAVERLEFELEGRPLIWLDDDFAGDSDAKNWVARRDEPTLAISPKTRDGLTPEHIQQIRDFAV